MSDARTEISGDVSDHEPRLHCSSRQRDVRFDETNTTGTPAIGRSRISTRRRTASEHQALTTTKSMTDCFTAPKNTSTAAERPDQSNVNATAALKEQVGGSRLNGIGLNSRMINTCWTGHKGCRQTG